MLIPSSDPLKIYYPRGRTFPCFSTLLRLFSYLFRAVDRLISCVGPYKAGRRRHIKRREKCRSKWWVRCKFMRIYVASRRFSQVETKMRPAAHAVGVYDQCSSLVSRMILATERRHLFALKQQKPNLKLST